MGLFRKKKKQRCIAIIQNVCFLQEYKYNGLELQRIVTDIDIGVFAKENGMVVYQPVKIPIDKKKRQEVIDEVDKTMSFIFENRPIPDNFTQILLSVLAKFSYGRVIDANRLR